MIASEERIRSPAYVSPRRWYGMKLRKNTLKPLRLQLDEPSVHPRLESIRKELLEDITSDLSFVRLPQRLLSEYAEGRTASVLGRIFQRVNRMHAIADRVVILGTGGWYLGAKAIHDACCQPYWNTLSRGERGSKPRMHWMQDLVDNDAIQSLLYMLGEHHGRVAANESERWGVILLLDQGLNQESAGAVRNVLRALQRQSGPDSERTKEQVLVVVPEGEPPIVGLPTITSPNTFEISKHESGCLSVLSPVGLIPAAMSGVNVIELLQGAAWMTDHFALAQASENLVLQYANVNHRHDARAPVSLRVWNLWNQALAGCGAWYNALLLEAWLGSEQECISLPMVQPRDRNRIRQLLQSNPPNKILHNLIVEEFRFDPLPMEPPPTAPIPIDPEGGQDHAAAISASPTIPAALQAAYTSFRTCATSHGIPTTELRLPKLDELHLGQLLQMMMLATAVETRLRGCELENH